MNTLSPASVANLTAAAAPLEPLRNVPLAEDQLSPAVKLELRTRGFGLTPAEVWGKVVGDGTAFLEIGATMTLAWVYLPEADSFLGERIQVLGEPDAAVPLALRNLEVLLQSHEVAGAEAFNELSVWERVQA